MAAAMASCVGEGHWACWNCPKSRDGGQVAASASSLPGEGSGELARVLYLPELTSRTSHPPHETCCAPGQSDLGVLWQEALRISPARSPAQDLSSQPWTHQPEYQGVESMPFAHSPPLKDPPIFLQSLNV